MIYGHSFALIKNISGSDFMRQLIGPNSAEVGVKTFFFLSGLLVVNSAISGKGAIAFTLNRFFRIWPALVFIILVTALVIGPLCTTLSISEYFNNPAVFNYIKHMTAFHTWGVEAKVITIYLVFLIIMYIKEIPTYLFRLCRLKYLRMPLFWRSVLLELLTRRQRQ